MATRLVSLQPWGVNCVQNFYIITLLLAIEFCAAETLYRNLSKKQKRKPGIKPTNDTYCMNEVFVALFSIY